MAGAAQAGTPVDPSIDPAAALAEAESQHAAAISPADRATLLASEAALLTRLDRLEEADARIRRGRALLRKSDEEPRAALLQAEAQVRAQRQDYAGAEQAARAASAILVRLHGANSVENAAAEATLAGALISQSKFDEGIPVAAHAWSTYEAMRPRGDPDRIDAGFQYASGLTNARRAEPAETLLRALVDEARLLPARHPYRAKLPKLLGTELLMQGRTAESIVWLREAVDSGETSGTMILGERADAMSVLGIALLMQDRPGDALPYLEAAIPIFAQAKAIPSQVGAYINAGTAADRIGDRAKAAAMREQGMALLKESGQASELVIALNEFKLAQTYANLGRLDEAEAMESHAVEVLTRLRPPTHFQNTNSRIALGWIEALRGRKDEGLARAKAAFRTSVAANESLEIAQNQVVGVLDNIEAYSQALQAAVVAGDTEFAFEAMQVMVETDASRAAVAVTQREEAGQSALGKLLRARQEAAVRLAAADAAMLAEQAKDLSADPSQLTGARAALDAIDADLDARFPGFRELLRPRTVSLAETQTRLSKGEALLVIEESDLGVYTMAITGRQVAMGHAPIRREALRALVSRVRAGIDDGDPDDFDVAAAGELYSAVFTPDIQRLIPPGTHLRIVTGDILSALPFSLLAVRPGKDTASTRWLIEDYPLSVLPSIAAMRRESARDGRGGSFLGIGAPDLERGPRDGARRGGERIAGLAPLPGAARELHAVAERLEGQGIATRVIAGSKATEAAVRRQNYDGVGILLFATHGLVAGRFDARSEPALVLTPPARTDETDAPDDGDDGLLTASEAASLRLDANWVILSACDTAGGEDPSAAGYTGLARAFLFAGAKRVVASHWPVRDDIAARLSLGVVTAAVGGKAPDEALRAAVLSVMHDRTLPAGSDPANWAPFMLVAR